MLRLPLRFAFSVGLLATGITAAGCGTEPEVTPTEYVRFNYTVTPPGTSTSGKPLVLTVGAAPMAMGVTCQRANNKIVVYASDGVASVQFTLNGATATMPNQVNLQATTQSVGSAEVELQIPTAVDEMRVYSAPVAFRTTTPGNALTCYLNLGGPDLYAGFDGSFTCQSLSTDPGRKLSLTDGQFHAVPCPSGG